VGTQLPLPQRAQPHQFSAHICCGQTAGWIKIPLGREVDFRPSDIVLDGDPAPLSWMDQDATWYGGRPRPRPHCVRWGPSFPIKNGHSPPLFCPCLFWSNGWMDQDATWYIGRPRPRPHCVTWGPSSTPRKRGTAPTIFGLCLLWPNGRPSQLLLSTCCAAYGREARYFKWAATFPSQKFPFAWGESGPHLHVWFLGLSRDNIPNGIRIGSAVF